MKNAPSFGFIEEPQTFWVEFPKFGLLRFLPHSEWDGKRVQALDWKSSANRKNEWVALNRQGVWILRMSALENSRLEISLTCRPSKFVGTVCLKPIVAQKFPVDHVLTHGRKMGKCGADLAERGGNVVLESHFLMAMTRGSTTLQISHPLTQKEISSFSGNLVGKQIKNLTASTFFESCRRKVLRAAPVSLSASQDGHGQMVSWARAQVASHEPLSTPQESGWNSWDYYRWTITEEEVLKNADLIASDPVLARHVRRIIVDDGWQYCYGEWEPNSLFPSGMKRLAGKLTEMGFIPGLWFAPTIVEPHSRLAQLHPEMLVRGAAGIPGLAFSGMERKGFLLDPTHPQVRAWWEELFRRYARYGYRYFKLDFLSWTVPSRQFAKVNTKPGDLMREIIVPIRKAVGSESRILGCNFSLEGGRGLADDVRISADIHANWNSVKDNVGCIAARFWAHQRFWINDPDFALCRGEETSDDPNIHQLKPLLPFVKIDEPSSAGSTGPDFMSSLVNLKEREAEVLLSLVITAGGAMNLSDNLPRLNTVGIGLLRKTVQAEKGNAAIPMDLFRAKYPAYWIQKLSSGLHRVLLVNWSDQKATLTIDLAALNVPSRNSRNFWTGESTFVKGGILTVNLLPHACLLAESHV